MDNIGGPAQFTYREAVAKGVIENGIRPLCDVLFDIGAIPLSSCEGHPLKKSLFNLIPLKRDSVKPFVLFSCSVDKARSINMAIIEKVGTWYVHGHFQANTQELVWSIEPIHIDYQEGQVDRPRIDNDVRSLVNAISEKLR